MKEIKKYILSQLGEGMISQNEAVSMLTELKEMNGRNAEEIAVTGMACRLPMAENYDEYWDNLMNGTCCFCAKPAEKKLFERVLENPYYAEFLESTLSDHMDDLESIIGAYIKDFDKFDADFFNITPREAKYIEPGQRVFLETAWSALEDAGYSTGNIRNTKTGVFVGKDYSNSLHYKEITAPDPMKVTGTWEGLLASRLSYAFNLSGPTMVIDTACSSGLVAVHEACSALRNGECDMAVAGGLSIGAGGAAEEDSEDQDTGKKEKESSNASAIGAVTSSDNRVRTFDKKCSGSVFGEGIVVFILKPLSKAVHDRDHVYAVIRGSAINNDGASNGITAPNPLAQEAVILDAWHRANINPEDIDYIEAHGTGTLLGDPIEILGITKAFQQFTSRRQFCGIGSVKTNIGHLVAASGCASLMKVILSMQNEVIPASINFEEPNNNIDFVDSPVYVVDHPAEWKKKMGHRLAGINAFGFSGTNSHMVVEDSWRPEKHTTARPGKKIVTLSGKTDTSLKGLVRRYVSFFRKNREIDFGDLCYTTNIGRGHYNYRLAIVAESIEELKEKLNRFVDNGCSDENLEGVFYGSYRVVSEKYTNRSAEERTERELRELSLKARDIIDEMDENTAPDHEKINLLAQLYVRGTDVPWEDLYRDEEHYKAALPTYYFDRISCWAAPKISKINPEESAVKKKIHPAIDKVLVSSYDETIFLARFSLDKHWFVREHKIMGKNIVPGTAYIEIVRAACAEYFGTDQIEISSLTFIQPLVVADDPVSAHIILKKKENGIDFTVASKDENTDRWVQYAAGSALPLQEKPQSVFDTAHYADGGTEVKIEIPDDETDELVYMGQRWHSVRHVYRNGDVLFSEVSLEDKFRRDLESYSYHPAMADAALNIPIQVFIHNDMYLPLSYEKLKIYKKLPKTFYSRMERLSGGNGSETMSFRVTLADGQGGILAAADRYTMKKVSRFSSYTAGTYYGMTWEKISDDVPAVSGETAGSITGNVMIFTDGGTTAEKFAEVLNNAGRIIFIEIGNKNIRLDDNHYCVDGTEKGYNFLFEWTGITRLDYVFHFAGVNNQLPDSHEESLETSEKKTIYSLFLFPKVMLRRISGKTRFFVFGQYAEAVNEADTVIFPINHAMLAMLKTMAQEYSNCIFQGFDITGEETPEQLYQAITSYDDHLILAVRDGFRFAEMLEQKEEANIPQADCIMGDEGVYLITGGTGGLGLAVAGYLTESGARHIALLARRRMPDREKWDEILRKNHPKKTIRCIRRVMEMEERGAAVVLVNADVSDTDQMRNVIGNLKKQYGRIRGVVHCAGVAGDGFLYNKSLDAFNEVILPKIKGSMVISDLLKKESPDFFIMFSSMQTAFGGSGQGDYTAANAFMDALGYRLRREGMNAKVINWPGWKETGMAVEYGVEESMTLFHSLPTQKALAGFDFIIRHDVSNIIPGEINYEFLRSAGKELPFELSHSIARAVKREAEKQTAGQEQQKGRRFDPEKLVIHGKSKEEYSEEERTVAYVCAAVLDINEIDIYENFNSMGADSIIAAEVLKQLNNQYHDILNISDMFTYPCVSEMADHICRLRVQAGEKATAAKHTDDRGEQ